jgi:hypothetical protein
MIVGVLSGIVLAGLLAVLSVVWRHRDHLALLRTTLYPRGRVRVAFSALLRVKDDDNYVLTRSTSRPDAYGPPGGVFEYFDSASDALNGLGFRNQSFDTRRAHMRGDLRGYVPARSLSRFIRWFAAEVDRESAAECLRRQLAEEMSRAGDPSLTTMLRGVTFTPVRVITEGPHPVPNQRCRELRRIEIYDLATDEASTRLRHRLLAMSQDPTVTSAKSVTGTGIISGWSGSTPIDPRSDYLLGLRRLIPRRVAGRLTVELHRIGRRADVTWRPELG